MKLLSSLRRAILLIAFLASFPACNGDSSSPIGEARVIVGFAPAPGGSYSARLDGKTFNGTGGFPITLTELGGTYELTGSFTGGALSVTFAASTSTGVQSGSLESLQGPVATMFACGVQYANSTTTSQQFRLRFKVTATAALVCS